MLVFVGGGKPENPEKNPRNKARTNNKLNPHEDGEYRNRTRVREVGLGRAFIQCASHAPRQRRTARALYSLDISKGDDTGDYSLSGPSASS